MKQLFLAFSILLSFSFSWADRSANPGNDPIEAMKTNGGGLNVAGHTGVCADCAKHSKNYRLFDDTVKRSDGSSTNDKEGGSKAEGATQ